jgi:hypothetical protein
VAQAGTVQRGEIMRQAARMRAAGRIRRIGIFPGTGWFRAPQF